MQNGSQGILLIFHLHIINEIPKWTNPLQGMAWVWIGWVIGRYGFQKIWGKEKDGSVWAFEKEAEAKT